MSKETQIIKSFHIINKELAAHFPLAVVVMDKGDRCYPLLGPAAGKANVEHLSNRRTFNDCDICSDNMERYQNHYLFFKSYSVIYLLIEIFIQCFLCTWHTSKWGNKAVTLDNSPHPHDINILVGRPTLNK